MVCDRHPVAPGGCPKGAGGRLVLPQERQSPAAQYRPQNAARAHLHGPVRVERPRLSGEPPADRVPRAVGAGAGRSRRPSRQAPSPRQARVRVLRSDRMRSLRLRGRRRDQEAAIRLLSLHRLQGCDEPYVREEVLERRFADLLGRLTFDDEVLDWRCGGATPTRSATTRRPSPDCKPSTTAFRTGFTRCTSTSSTGVSIPHSSISCRRSAELSKTAAYN